MDAVALIREPQPVRRHRGLEASKPDSPILAPSQTMEGVPDPDRVTALIQGRVEEFGLDRQAVFVGGRLFRRARMLAGLVVAMGFQRIKQVDTR